jgi:hypothetical protein
VSPLWKSELVIRLGRAHATALLRTAWHRQVAARASAPGRLAEAIPALLQALREQGVAELPKHVRLLVPDEHTYLALLPADTAWRRARQRGLDHFAAALGRHDLEVQVIALRGGHWWLAAAIETAELAAWRRQLDAAGLVLGHVGLALLDDLAAIAHRVADNGVVAMLREEGVTLVRMAQGAPVELAWERCDPHAQSCIEQRLLAFQGAGEAHQLDRLLMLCQSQAQHDDWLRLAAAHRWTLLSPRNPAEVVTA